MQLWPPLGLAYSLSLLLFSMLEFYFALLFRLPSLTVPCFSLGVHDPSRGCGMPESNTHNHSCHFALGVAPADVSQSRADFGQHLRDAALGLFHLSRFRPNVVENALIWVDFDLVSVEHVRVRPALDRSWSSMYQTRPDLGRRPRVRKDSWTGRILAQHHAEIAATSHWLVRFERISHRQDVAWGPVRRLGIAEKRSFLGCGATCSVLATTWAPPPETQTSSAKHAISSVCDLVCISSANAPESSSFRLLGGLWATQGGRSRPGLAEIACVISGVADLGVQTLGRHGSHWVSVWRSVLRRSRRRRRRLGPSRSWRTTPFPG